MSPATQSYFLPKVFPTELFTLGQFVSNPLTPTIFPFTGVQTGEIVEAKPEIPFETVACVDKRGWLGLKVPRLIEIGGGGDSGRLLRIKAEEMRYRTLRDPDTVFKKTLEHSEEARKWMNEMKLNDEMGADSSPRRPRWSPFGKARSQSTQLPTWWQGGRQVCPGCWPYAS
jgi:hypothetical protein